MAGFDPDTIAKHMPRILAAVEKVEAAFLSGVAPAREDVGQIVEDVKDLMAFKANVEANWDTLMKIAEDYKVLSADVANLKKVK